MTSTVDVEALLRRAVSIYHDQDTQAGRIRVAGSIEGILMGTGITRLDTQYCYKEITVENPSIFAPWFPGTKRTITRTERFNEMIVRVASEYLSTRTD